MVCVSVKVHITFTRYEKKMKVLVAQSLRTFCDPMDCSQPSSSVHEILQGIFLTQGSNLGLLHCRQILYYLSRQGNPATHSSILTWRIPWMEEPDGLQSTGLQRVLHS